MSRRDTPAGFRWRGRKVRRAAVIGSGQIGPDIALHLVKVLAPRGAHVVIQDIAAGALERGRAKMFGKIAKGVRSGAFHPVSAEAMRQAARFATDPGALAGADLIIEAASEDLGVKRAIFASAERVAAPDALLLSNSSHLEPDRLFAGLERPERAAVAHYFFPAERNPVVEIVADGPARGIVPWLLSFYEEIGKVPVEARARFGHALNPIFEGLFLAAARAVEEGLGTTREVDDAARRVLRLGIGPFTAMNLTGGNPITYEGFGEMHERLHPWFRVPRLLEEAMAEGGATGRTWDVPARGEGVDMPAAQREAIEERILAAFCGLVGWTAASKAMAPEDLDVSCCLALAVHRPFALMRKLGSNRVRELTAAYREREPAFFEPEEWEGNLDSWTRKPMSRIGRRDVRTGAGVVAVLVIRRPEALGALDQDLWAELDGRFAEAEADDEIAAVVVTGFGVKAFAAGADVRMFTSIRSPEEGAALSRGAHQILDRIAAFPKPVVCSLNGMAVGGGNELAMACHARIGREGLEVLAMQPEPNLGILPGAGGTQRLPRLIGVAAAWEPLRTGRPLAAAEALELGLVSELVPGEALLDRAVALAAAAASGAEALPKVAAGPMPAPESLPEVDIGHRSRAVDALIRRAILEGARGDLASGLRLETRLFGRNCALEDMKIGVRNFLDNGPRSPAPFLHR